jgi:hypothetical protein
MSFEEPMSGPWPLPVSADLLVWDQPVPIGAFSQRFADLRGEDTLLLNASGGAEFARLVTTTAGRVSVHFRNAYLSDASMAATRPFAVAPGAAAALKIEAADALVRFLEPFRAVVAVTDAFYNFQPDHAGAVTVSATPAGDGSPFRLRNATVRDFTMITVIPITLQSPLSPRSRRDAGAARRAGGCAARRCRLCDARGRHGAPAHRHLLRRR